MKRIAQNKIVGYRPSQDVDALDLVLVPVLFVVPTVLVFGSSPERLGPSCVGLLGYHLRSVHLNQDKMIFFNGFV